MRVLLTVASFSTAYGGPAVSVGGLADALSRLNATVGVWAPDSSQLTSSLVTQQSNLHRLDGALRDVFVRFRPEIVHDNGIWLLYNHRIAALTSELRVPRIVSVRGALDPWSRRHKRLKKTVAWMLYQRHDLIRAQCHHATAELEAKNLRSYALGVPVIRIPNGVAIPSPAEHLRNDSIGSSGAGCKVALFFGRMHPVKGLDILIEAWARIRSPEWKLRIVGPDEGGHRLKLQRLASQNNLNELVEFCPAIAPEVKSDAYTSANLLVLPSLSENFGMVVAEALAHGVPVLTTTGTPWTELEERGCGWCVLPTREGIETGLRRALATAPDELVRMGSLGREWVRSELCWNSVGTRFLQVYEAVLREHLGKPEKT